MLLEDKTGTVPPDEPMSEFWSWWRCHCQESNSQDWQQRVWVDVGVVITEQINFEMTLRKEKRGQRYHWYAYRKVLGVQHKRYVGYSEDITEQKLIDIARRLPGA